MDMISTNAGLTVASVTPRKKRFVAMPAKDVHAGVVIRMAPQIMVTLETNLPMGRTCKAYAAGNCAIK